MKERTDFDTPGAPALPGGLAEVRRTLQAVLEPGLPDRQIPKGRGMRGFFAWRKKRQDVTA